jgi:hypothetical protein
VAVIELDRGQLLRLGAGGLAGLSAAGLLLPAAAGAAAPAPAPADDDLAFLSFATMAERASRDVYRAAHRRRGTGLSARERRHIELVASTKRAHIKRLDAVLGADAPAAGDFVTVLPKGAVDTRARILGLGARLETLLVRVYLTGVAYAEDSATRLLLGRLLAYDSQALAWLRVAAGTATPAGLPGPIDLEPAAAQLDAFLSTPDFQD